MDNARMKPKMKINEAVFSAKLYEFVLENLQTIDGFSTYSTVAGTLTTVVAEAHGTGWVINTPIKADFKNANNTSIGSIVVKAGAGTLVLNTDYRTYV